MVGSERKPANISPDRWDRLLGAGSLLMLAAVFAALIRGHDRWSQVPLLVWLHLLTIILALMMTPLLLFGRRGTRRHRLLGWTWAGAMTATAAISLGVRGIDPGGFSAIHILSLITLVSVPLLVFYARRHNVVAHRSAVRSIVTGALLIAGFFTFPFGRMLGQWLFG